MKPEEAFNKPLGMSEPFFFSANVSKDKRTIIFHCVIFTSFEVPAGGDTNEVLICSENVDPRMPDFLKFVWSNWLKDKKKEFEGRLAEVEREMEKRNTEIKALIKTGEDLKDEAK